MMRAMSSGVAGLKAHQTAIDVVGNNIANVNTYGYKTQSTIFRDSMYQKLAAASAADTTTGAGGINPSQVGYGSYVSTIVKDSGSASMNTTGNGMDCYINGEGYFVIGTGATTPTSYEYTRVGSLKFDDAGYLTDGNGNRVCGNNVAYTYDTSTPRAVTASTLQSPTSPAYIKYPDDGATDPKSIKLHDISIASDGTITATTPEKKVITLGQIQLATFVNPEGLTLEGNSYYQASSNSGDASYTTPGSGSSGTLTTSALEGSNVDLANEFANMIQFERGFQANSKIISVSDEMLETLVNLKR